MFDKQFKFRRVISTVRQKLVILVKISLEKFCRFDAAKEGFLDPVIGRASEIQRISRF